MDDETLNKMFKEFADKGIQESEIEAAYDCLVRENGFVPTEFEIAMYVKEYIEWRVIQRMQKNSECTVNVKITPYGRMVATISRGVDKIGTAWKIRNERG